MSEIDFAALALHRLSVREYGSGEMRAYLRKKGASADESRRIVSDLLERGMISDERYARVIARHQAHRDKGPAYVMMKLRQKGVDIGRGTMAEIFQEVLPEAVASELELARRVAEKRYPSALGKNCDRKQKSKAIAALARRGFSHAVIAKIFEE
ncbi:MAG: regulatory protein RecX [Oligoflexia bacterium]|nr:regulatory protein RecX [Oligoflexia bacterium]